MARSAEEFGQFWLDPVGIFWRPFGEDRANNPGHALGGTVFTAATFAVPGGALIKAGSAARTANTVSGGSRIAANQAAGNAARDALATAQPGALIEQSIATAAGVRRLDILTQSGLGIESKVGRTSLTVTTQSQVAKDSLLLRSGDVSGIEWVFSRSAVTGKIGPTAPLAEALDKAGISWRLAP